MKLGKIFEQLNIDPQPYEKFFVLLNQTQKSFNDLLNDPKIQGDIRNFIKKLYEKTKEMEEMFEFPKL